MSIFEIIMIVCFGISWPFSIYKSYKTKDVEGKSALFLMFVFVGYLAGIMHKIIFSFDFVIILYTLNALMVFTDMMLYLKYRRNKCAVKSDTF